MINRENSMDFDSYTRGIGKSVNGIDRINEREVLGIERDPSFVIRKTGLAELEGKYKGKLSKDYNSLDLVKLGKSLFDELRSDYNIDVPVNFFIGSDKDNNEALFSVVDRIEEPVLSDEDRNIAIQKFHKLYETLSQYYLDKLKDEKPFLVDINATTQYVYGDKIGDKKTLENKIYLVDTDIYMDDRPESLLTVVYWLARHGSDIDKDSKMFNNIKAFIEGYQDKFPNMDTKNQQRISQLKSFLSGGDFGDEILPAIPIFEDD